MTRPAARPAPTPALDRACDGVVHIGCTPEVSVTRVGRGWVASLWATYPGPAGPEADACRPGDPTAIGALASTFAGALAALEAECAEQEAYTD